MMMVCSPSYQSLSFSSAMACTIYLPSVSLKNNLSSASSSSCDGSGIRRFGVKIPARSRVFMSVSTGSQISSVVDDALFKDYKPHYAFLFPGQGAQAIGMGKEAQSVPAAADLYKKANDILGYDLLELCTSGPKEKLDSTVISQDDMPKPGQPGQAPRPAATVAARA